MTTSSASPPDADPPSPAREDPGFGVTGPPAPAREDPGFVVPSRADALLTEALHRVWGFSDFRPLQREAMHAILHARDSVVVLPTGGGKSLCFQAPAIVEADARPKASRSSASDDSLVERDGFSRAPRRGLAL